MKNQLKKLSLVFLLLISTQWLQAQTEKAPPPKVPDYIQNADYIFEGTVVDTKGYLTKAENGTDEIYTSLLVQVSNIFKGNGMKLGLVQIIVKGGAAQSPYDKDLFLSVPYYPSHGEKIPRLYYNGEKGILFGKVVSNNKGFIWNNQKIENPMILEEDRAIGYCHNCLDGKEYGWFDDKKSMLQYFKQFNLKTDFIDRSDIVEDSIAKIQQQIQLKEELLLNEKQAQDAKDYDKHMNKIQNAKIGNANVKKNAKINVNVNLNVDIRNYTYTTNAQNQNFIEFDVFAWGNSTTYLNALLVKFNYDKYAFGDSIYKRNAITATLGSSFNNSNYKIYLAPQSDILDSVVSIPFGTNDSLATVNRIALSTTPLQVMHIKIKIKNCTSSAKLQLTDKALTSFIFTNYVLTATVPDTTIYTYDLVTYTEGIQPIPLCPTPKITGFSPSVIRAGTGEILTITGTGFGATRGKGQVLFPNADLMGSYLKSCDSTDYISWTNNEIKVKVPSVVYTDSSKTAGSGKFKVVNDLKYRDSTNTNLDIEFALANATLDNVTKQRVNWSYFSCQNTAFVFKLGQSLQPYQQAVAIIDSAINAWAKFLNIDIRLQKNDTLGYQYFADNAINNLDGNSMIYVDNSLTTAAMETRPVDNYCTTDNNARRYGADIGIKMSINWLYRIDTIKPSGKADFYSDILHELGHAIGLGHVINPNATTNLTHELELMFWYETLNIQKLITQRSTLNTGRLMAQKASLYLRDSSKAVNWACSSFKKIREFRSPSNVKVCQNSNALFSVYVEQLAGSPAPTYQWQFKTSTGTWQNVGLLTAPPYNVSISDGISPSFSITSATNAVNNLYFRCIVGGIDGCSINSQVAKLTVTPGPTITTQPVNTSNTAGSTTAKTFSLTASGNVTYQWYKGTATKNNPPLTNVAPYSGVTTNTLTITGTTGFPVGQTSFFCIVTDVVTGCQTKSNIVTLTINAPKRMSAPIASPVKENPLIFNIYPNPANNNLSIQLNNRDGATVHLKLLNNNGFEILNKQYNNDEIQLDVSNIPSGLYIIQLNDGNTISTKEIIITH